MSKLRLFTLSRQIHGTQSVYIDHVDGCAGNGSYPACAEEDYRDILLADRVYASYGLK